MNGKWLSIVALVAVAGLLFGVNSCGRSQELVGIQIQPASQTFGAADIRVIDDAGAQVQLKALGTYIHPPVTKDITGQVTWTSNTPQMITVDSSGVITVTGAACGGTIISATVNTNKSSGGISSSGAIVTGSMTANVVCFTSSGGGAGSPALTVTFLGNGSGAVTDSSQGFSCFSPGPCVAAFTSGATVALSAAPNTGSTFASWADCDTPASTNPCMVTLTSNHTVVATFN